jgi:transposase
LCPALSYYFLRTNLGQTDEKTMWDTYNTIREIEATFRVLKSDLSLRPIFHKNDESTEAHLYLSILAYTVVNTIRFRLKNKGIHHDWQNITRIMNTQKSSTTTMERRDGKQVIIRVCSSPSMGAQEIYTAMGYKPMPFYRKKFVFPEC